MLCDTHALSNYTGIITLLTETLKLVHHHRYRTCSRAPGKYHCVYTGFFLCAHKTEKKTQNCRKLLVLRASRLRSESALILCGFSRRGSDAGALCVISAAWHKANIVPSGLFAPTRAASRRHSTHISQTFTARARKWCPSLLPLQCDVMTD